MIFDLMMSGAYKLLKFELVDFMVGLITVKENLTKSYFSDLLVNYDKESMFLVVFVCQSVCNIAQQNYGWTALKLCVGVIVGK